MSTKKTTTKKAPKSQAEKKVPTKKATAKVAEPHAKTAKPPRKSDSKLSALDAAAKVLAESGEPLTSKAMIDAMATKGYWTSPGGKTPHATLYAAILREILSKGVDARFTKTERGHFTINAGASAPAPAKPTKATDKKAAKKKTNQAEIADGTPGPKAVSELFKI